MSADDFSKVEQARMFAMLLHPDTILRRSQINVGHFIVVNGITGLDACERSYADCFRTLLSEEDGGISPGRLSIVVENTRTDRKASGQGAKE